MAVIATELREVGKATAPASKEKKEKGGKKKESKKKRTEETADIDVDVDSNEDNDGAVPSLFSKAVSQGLEGVQAAIEHRAVILFGVAAWAIYTFGEAISI